MWVALVQVRHRGHEPSLDGLLQVYFRGVGVHHGREFIRCLQVGTLGRLRAVAVGREARHRVAAALLLREPLWGVQPVLRRHILRPGVLKAAVVEDHVHHHLQPFLMSLVAETAVVFVGAEAGIHAIVVGCGIAVIGRVAVLGVWRVVLKHRRQPEGGHTEFLEVVQMLADAVQVAAMPQRGFRAVFNV